MVFNTHLPSWFLRIVGRKHQQHRRRRPFQPQLMLLEDRCLLSAPAPLEIPIPPDQIMKHTVDLKTIFWNGGDPLTGSAGVQGISSPDAAPGAGKTITITNYGPETIYPFLRSANTGQDPHASNYVKDVSGWYD